MVRSAFQLIEVQTSLLLSYRSIISPITRRYNTYTGKHNEKEAFGMKKAMEDLFYKYHVNAAFSGHVHAYERFLPMYKNVTNTNGTIYMTVGTGGQSYGKPSIFLLIASKRNIVPIL